MKDDIEERMNKITSLMIEVAVTLAGEEMPIRSVVFVLSEEGAGIGMQGFEDERDAFDAAIKIMASRVLGGVKAQMTQAMERHPDE